MVCKHMGIHGFWRPSWVLITVVCPTVTVWPGFVEGFAGDSYHGVRTGGIIMW